MAYTPSDLSSGGRLPIGQRYFTMAEDPANVTRSDGAVAHATGV